MKKNYFLSGWIANLGVVPLLRSAFLRFSPSFFVLLALRMLVCCVLDPINNLLMSKERSKLANNKLFVKALLVLPLGGHYDWEGLSGDYFQVVPMGCVKVTLMAPHNVPKLVAQKEGKCEVILFDKSHRRHRKQVQVVASSATTPPRTQQKAQKKEERVAVSWSKESRNRAVEEIYRLFYASSLDSISCQLPSIHGALQCFYDEATAPPALMLEKLKKKYAVDFWPTNSQYRRLNYRVKLRLFQLEKGNGEHFEMGLSELKASLPEISQKGALFLEEQLRVHLKRQEIDVKTLAVPEAILATHGKWHLQMGQETPLTLEGKDHHMSTSWHFSGLKIDVELLPVGEGIRVDYKVELTSPVGSQVHGNKESASLFVKEGELLPLFQLAYENQSEEAAHFPLLHYLPLIGSLFRSLDHREAYKKICGFLVIDHEEINANPSLTSLPSLSTP